MARQIKNNAQWFTHDFDMRNDVKIKALRRKFGNNGYAVWCYLLESLTDTDFFELDFSDIDIELLAADYDVTPEELKDIAEYCCRIKLLQKTGDGVKIYSEALKRRFEPLNDLRNKRSEAGKKGMEKRWGSNEDNDDITMDNKVITSDNLIQYNTIQDNTIQKNTIQEKKDIYPYRDIVALWNDICKSLPQVKTLNDTRRQKIKTRLNEIAPNMPQIWRDKIKELFQRIQASDFLTGGTTGWKASFDWVFENSKNWVKVMEGNYDNENRKPRQTGQRTKSIDGTQLGVGERIEDGRRTYGTGIANIPLDAPARPSERHQWDKKTNNWILL